MSAADWPLLEPAEEDALHLTRLLSVEERPFHRITRRLLAKDALLHKFPVQLPTPPPDLEQEGEEATETLDISYAGNVEARRQYHDDILLDFAQLESTLIRIQFLKDANERERARYAEEKSKIMATADAIRSNTAELHVQLAEAQRLLALKKEYDALAENIFKERALKSRDVLQNEGDKLRAEIEDLEQEGRDFAGVWTERRERFDRVVEEGAAFTRYLSGEKEEGSPDDEGQTQDGEEGEAKGNISTVGTPRPEAGGATPVHIGMQGEDAALAAQQELAQRAIGNSLRVPQSQSRSTSPAPQAASDRDTLMGEIDNAGSEEGSGTSVDAVEAGKELPTDVAETMDTS